MTRGLTLSILGSALLASGILATSTAQACSGLACYARPGGGGSAGAIGGQRGVVSAPAFAPKNVAQGHGGVVSAGAGNGLGQLPKGATMRR